MRFRNFQFASSISCDGSFQTQPVLLEKVPTGYFIQGVFTGSPNGSAKLQASGDSGIDAPPTNWIDIPDSTLTISGAQNVGWNVSQPRYRFVSVVFTAVSGSGFFSATVNINGDNEN
jgi:hypothetical protein